MNRRPPGLLPVIVLGVLLMLGACTSSGSDSPEGQTTPDYTPISDEKLYATIADLPGVEAVDIRFNDTWPEAKYGGEVTIEPDADAQDVLDATYAVLRQGRPGVGISVFGIQDQTSISFERLDGRSGIPSELTKRYGAQPGDGTPPQG